MNLAHYVVYYLANKGLKESIPIKDLDPAHFIRYKKHLENPANQEAPPKVADPEENRKVYLRFYQRYHQRKAEQAAKKKK